MHFAIYIAFRDNARIIISAPGGRTILGLMANIGLQLFKFSCYLGQNTTYLYCIAKSKMVTFLGPV